MKIIKNNAVYVQITDLAFLNTTRIHIPNDIYDIIFENGIVILDETNQYDFMKFDGECIDFFKNLDWMIDLLEIIKLSEKEIILLAKDTLIEYNKLKREYDSMPLQDQYKNRQLKQKIELLDYKFNSIGYALQFYKGNIKIDVPTEILEDNHHKKEKNKKRRILKK